MPDRDQPSGRDENGLLWVDGRVVSRFSNHPDPSPKRVFAEELDVATPTPGPCSASSLQNALQDRAALKPFLHLCNTFAEFHAASFASCLLDVPNGDTPTPEQKRATKLVEQLYFELCASLADFFNSLPPECGRERG